MPPPTLVFDGDFAFCSRCAAVAARVLPGDCVVVPWQRFDLASAGVTAERARSEVLWIGRDGAVSGGAPAVAQALRSAGGWWSVPGALLLLPPLSWVAPWVYRLVAANRYRLPGGTAACRVPPPGAGAAGPPPG
ncbi:thiol-disulfide oxidoreductase DCC family protein [Modestobacter sp. URMC 112]